MGKASKWFRNLLGLRKPDSPLPASQTRPVHRDKRLWSFVKSYREKGSGPTTTTAAKHTASTTNNAAKSSQYEREPITATECDVDRNKHATAVAVFRLTSSSDRGARNPTAHFSSGCGAREALAAVTIQSAFRGYLARRALRALKGLVRLQALVRGHIERKRTAEWLRRMQALLRAQERVCAGRIQISESSQTSSKTSHFNNPGPLTPEKFEHAIRSKSAKFEQTSIFKRNGSKSNGRIVNHEKVHGCRYRSDNKIKMDEQSWDQAPSTRISTAIDNEKNDSILDVDTGTPRLRSRRRNLFHSTQLARASDQYNYSLTRSKESNQTFPSLSSSKVQSTSPLKFSHEVEESSFTTAENSPQFYSASFRGGSSKTSPYTPAKSDGSKSCKSGYSDHPNYMAFTESSRAKVRSLSAPKQRPQYERSSSTKRHSFFGFGEPRFNTQTPSLHANFTNQAYRGSGGLVKLGMPTRQRS